MMNEPADDMEIARANAAPLVWQLRMTSTLERDNYIFSNELWTDCLVIVGTDKAKRTFKCHRVYLAKSSPVLAKMFYSNKKNGVSQTTISLPDIQPIAFREILSYIYTDSICQMGWEEMEAVARAAWHLELRHLLKACVDHLKTLINVTNVCPLYEFAKKIMSDGLSQICFKLMCENTSRVLEQPNFDYVSQGTLVSLLKQENLHIASDIPLIEACLKWAKIELECKGTAENYTNIREALGPAFSLLRFLSLTPAQFAAFSNKFQLLSVEESLSILTNLSCPGITELSPDVCPTLNTRHGYLFGHGRVFLCQVSMTGSYFSSGQPKWCELSFEFEMTSDLILLGAQICSQMTTPQIASQVIETETPMAIDEDDQIKTNGKEHQNVDLHDTTENKFYREDLDVTFEKPKPRSRVSMHFDSLVQYNSLISVKFDKPFLILKGEKYRLFIHFRKKGWYPTGNSSGTMKPLGADLNFEAKENFFHSLVFTR